VTTPLLLVIEDDSLLFPPLYLSSEAHFNARRLLRRPGLD